MQAPRYHVIESRQFRGQALGSAAQTNGAAESAAAAPGSAAAMWRDTVVVTQGGDVVLAVAIGPDGMVWSYRLPATQTAGDAVYVDSAPEMDGVPSDLFDHYKAAVQPQATSTPRAQLRCTHLCADTISVGFDAQNQPIVFAGQGLEVQYATCVDVSEMRWTTPRYASMQAPENAERIERIVAKRMDGALHVGAMLRVPGETGAVFNAAYANWDAHGPEFRHTPVFVDSVERVQVQSLLQKAADSMVGQLH